MHTPYHYTLDNPLRYVDVHGDSIKVKNVQQYDQTNNTHIAETMVSDLQAETGLTITIDKNGQMQFAKDKDGNAVISKDKDGNAIGSATARDLFTSAVGKEETANVSIGGNKSGNQPGTLDINISARQVDAFIAGANNVDSRTMGYGMTLLHETMHTSIGGSLTDAGNGGIGQVEGVMNKIRGELNQNGMNFGQRLSYKGMAATDSGDAFVPFDAHSLNVLKNYTIPDGGDKYVSYPDPNKN